MLWVDRDGGAKVEVKEGKGKKEECDVGLRGQFSDDAAAGCSAGRSDKYDGCEKWQNVRSDSEVGKVRSLALARGAKGDKRDSSRQQACGYAQQVNC